MDKNVFSLYLFLQADRALQASPTNIMFNAYGFSVQALIVKGILFIRNISTLQL